MAKWVFGGRQHGPLEFSLLSVALVLRLQTFHGDLLQGTEICSDLLRPRSWSEAAPG